MKFSDVSYVGGPTADFNDHSFRRICCIVMPVSVVTSSCKSPQYLFL